MNDLSLIIPELGQIVDGKSMGEHLSFYNINVVNLQSMSHDQFAEEFPNAVIVLAKVVKKIMKLQNLLED